MNQIQLINATRVIERRLEMERESNRNRRVRSYAEALAELQRLQAESKSRHRRFSKSEIKKKTVYCHKAQESYLEAK